MKLRISIIALVAVLASPLASAQPQVAPNEVRLCEHPDYLGHCESFFLEPHMRQRLERRLSPALANKVSSIAVGSGVVAVGIVGYDFNGIPRTYGRNESDLKKVFSCIHVWNKNNPPPRHCDNRIASLIVARRVKPGTYPSKPPPPDTPYPNEVAGIALSSTLNWLVGKLTFYPLPQDLARRERRFSALRPFNDNQAEAVWLYGGAEVELYDYPDFKVAGIKVKGKRLDLPGDSGKSHFELRDYGMSNSVSSLIVRARPGAPAPGVLHLPPQPPQRPEGGGEAAGEPHRAPPAGTTPAVIPGQITVPPVSLEPDTNRPGQDYRNVEIPQSVDSMAGPGAGADMCRGMCADDPKCKAFTYVKPNIQGQSARCWLKHGVPPAQPMPCCVSGVKR
jgi:hypothetical protein